MATNYPINPRVRALGKARIDIAQRASSPAEWQKLWKRPAHAFPFDWGERWKQCVEYRVDDFAAEVGFFIDILGLPVNAFDPDYAMFTSPEGDFYFAVVPATPGGSTPPEALRMQFMVADIFETTSELERRGIAFEQPPQPVRAGAALHIACFRSPHGIPIDLWGMVQPQRPPLQGTEGGEENEDIFLPSADSAFTVFTPQDAAPLATGRRLHSRAAYMDDVETEAQDEPDEDEAEAQDETDEEDEADDIEYVDIDSA